MKDKAQDRTPPVALAALHVLVGLGSLSFASMPQQSADPIREFERGDVFAAIGDGKVVHYDPQLNELRELDTGFPGLTAGMAFDGDRNLYVTNFSHGSITRFSKSGQILEPNPFVNSESTNESIVFDSSGNFYVGIAGEARSEGDDRPSVLFRFDADGTRLDRFEIPGDWRGADWIELDRDQRTIFYTSEGSRILRFDTAENRPLPDFATLPEGEGVAFALRLLPLGGLLVASAVDIKRFDEAGNLLAEPRYDIEGDQTWFALNLDPDGKSFWSGDIPNPEVSGSGNTLAKFDITTGDLRLQTRTRGNLSGVAVYDEPVVAQTVPRLITQSRDDARRILEPLQLEVGFVTERVSTERPGTIVGQSPPPGARVPPGSAVAIEISTWIPVPELEASSEEAARERLLALELVPRVGERRLSARPVGSVFEQEPSPGEEVPPGTGVTFVVATGVEAPAFVGRRLEEVASLIERASLAIGTVTERETADSPPGTVLAQTPGPGQLVPLSGAIDFTVAVAPIVVRDVRFWVIRGAFVFAPIALVTFVLLPLTVHAFPTFSATLGLHRLVLRLGVAALFSAFGVKLLQSVPPPPPPAPTLVVKPHHDPGKGSVAAAASLRVESEMRLRAVRDEGSQTMVSHGKPLVPPEAEEES